MRNLKRALSLTLASVMLLGMMVVGSSAAAGYDDVKDTDNVEAIEVLQEIEVMVGDERGFGPDRPVNRAEMAVVMGKLLNLDYNYYESACPFTDVSGNYAWAKGWVGAAYANKILSGRSATVFDPGATVTAVEAASMMMRALGYFQYAEDVADGFVLATVKQGTDIGIFNGVGSDGNAPMTRNQVAQMALNALRSEMVTFTGTPGVDVNGVKVGYRAEYTPRTGTEKKYDAIASLTTTLGKDESRYYIQLGEQLYDGKLKLDDPVLDVFGRPSRYWEYDGKAIGTYAKYELMDKEYVGKVTGKDLFDLLGKTTIDKYDIDCYVDGVYTEEDSATKQALGYVSESNLGAYFTKADMNKNNKAGIGETGTGTVTQVFVDHEDDQVNVVVINTYLAIADKDYDTKKEVAPLTVYSIDWKNTIDEYVKTKQPTSDKETNLDLAVEDFPSATEIKKDDPLLVTVAQGEIQTYRAAEVLEGVTISSFKKWDNVVTGGTKYAYTTTAAYKNADDINQSYTASNISNLKDRTYNIYLDTYGNLIGIEEVDAVKNYVFITGIDLNGSNITNTTADANAIFLDGTMETIRINRTKSKLTVTGTSDDAILNTWCTYTKSGDIYTVKEVSDVGVTEDKVGNAPVDLLTRYPDYKSATQDNNGLAQFNQIENSGTKSDIAVGGKNIRMYGGGKTGAKYFNVYGDSDTVYLTAELGELVNDDTNYGVIDEVVSVTTGVANTDLTAWNNANALKNAEDKDVKGTVKQENCSSGIYGLYDDDGLIIAAIVIGEDAGSAKDLVYVHTDKLEEERDNASGSAKANYDDLWTWTRYVIRDGQEVLLTEVGDEYDADNSLSQMLQYHWYEIRTNADGHVTKAVEASEALAEYEKSESGASQYVITYSKINDAVETSGVDNVLYLTDGGPEYVSGKLDYTNGFTTDLEVRGKNTLAVEGKTGSGIHFRDDVHVVLQYWNKNTKTEDIMEGEGVDDLKKMVDVVNENNDYKDRASATYYVSALIKDGRATDIVIFDSYNTYKRPGEVVDANGNLEGLLTGADGNVVYTVSPIGKLSATVTYTAPEYAADRATVTMDDIDVYNGTLKMGTLTAPAGKAINAKGEATFSYTSDAFDFYGLENTSLTFVQVDKETLSAVRVKYVDAADKDIVMKAGSTATATLDVTGGAGKALSFTADDRTYDSDTNGTFAVAGLDTASVSDVNGTKTVTPGAQTDVHASTKTLLAKGDNYVTVTVTGLKPATPSYVVNELTSSNTLADLYTGTIPDGASALKIKATGSRNTGLATGDTVVITFDPDSTKLADTVAYGVKVTVDVNGKTQDLVFPNNDTAPAWSTKMSLVVANKDIDIKVTNVTTIAAPKIKSITASDVDGDGKFSVTAGSLDTITIVFDQELSAVPAITKAGTLDLNTGAWAKKADGVTDDKTTVIYTVKTGHNAADTLTIAAKQIKTDEAINIDGFTITTPAAIGNATTLSFDKTT